MPYERRLLDGAHAPANFADGAQAPERTGSSHSNTGAKQQSLEAANALLADMRESYREAPPLSQLHKPMTGTVC